MTASENLDHSPEALAKLCQTYWHPIFVFIRHKGIDPHAAQDLTQSFLADFLARNQLSRADRGLGKFRSFLVSSLENFLHNQWRRSSAQKRGGGRANLSIESMEIQSGATLESTTTEDPARAFDREWARTLIHQTLDELQSEWDRKGQGGLCRELITHLWGDSTSTSYADLGKQFGLTQVNLRVTYHRFRQRYHELLRKSVAATVSTEDQVDEELRYLVQSVSH